MPEEVKNFVHSPIKLGYDDLTVDTGKSGRTYLTPSGEKLPSITTVLSIRNRGALQEWRNAVGEEEANRVGRHAATRGTAVHAVLERYIKNEPALTGKEMPATIQMFNQARMCVDRRLGKIFLQEASLYSTHLGVAGRVDLVAEWDGTPSIIDFKTSGRVKKEKDIHDYFLQESAYAIMVEERTGLCVPQLVTIIMVEGSLEPHVFVQKRDRWAPELLETINEYKKNLIFGHA